MPRHAMSVGMTVPGFPLFLLWALNLGGVRNAVRGSCEYLVGGRGGTERQEVREDKLTGVC